MSKRSCRLCGAAVELSLVDLGAQPLANDLKRTAAEATAAARFGLHAMVCESCWLVQIVDLVAPGELFSDYVYLSSYSTEWLRHVDALATWAGRDLGIGAGATVVEIGSNDGCLLRGFADRGATVLGVDPAANVAAIAKESGVPTVVAFFGRATAEQLVADGVRPDLVVANNVFAHVPDIDDFVAGLGVLAGASTTISIEVPHVLAMLDGLAFDTIYHEHHSYFSLAVAEQALRASGLTVVDVHRLPTHGGSLRLLVRRDGRPSPAVAALRAEEDAAGLTTSAAYEAFGGRVAACLDGLRTFLDGARRVGDEVAGYGAAAKATVLLNAVGATVDDISVIGDRNIHKIGRFVPGAAVPIVAEDTLLGRKPHHIVIFPWNIEHEVANQLAEVSTWGGELVVAVPALRTAR